MMNIRVSGVDVGRQHTGVTTYDITEGKIYGNFTISLALADVRQSHPCNPQYYRLDLMGSILREKLREANPVLVVVEDYIYGKRPITAEDVENMDRDPLKLAEMHGRLCSVIASLDLPMIKISPSQMKLFATGSGTADKRKMIKHVYQQYKVSLEDEHQYDALAAAHIGRVFLLYLRNPMHKVFKNQYYATVCNNIMFDKRFEGVATMTRGLLEERSEVV
jgi:Holliday junction resolvasome RuvABC endonuclease subunit